MTANSLNVFMQMANNYDIFDDDKCINEKDGLITGYDGNDGESATEKSNETDEEDGKDVTKGGEPCNTLKRVGNSYLLGFKKLQIEITKDPRLDRFKRNMPLNGHLRDEDDDEVLDPAEDFPRYEI
ncbi:hypothetical protein PtA15_4A485 [Puccinia triticina]|uniref:Uncharacterized protein n=1 Tax=Puccinia triticina TaxID=208348 RepID=A0ABY7CG08_9BASI|nr:uncharacterized protein PtA15_4A485 [Puccinia triticina]WAQ84034.1 hypothetical protein PtA15_4A485 [Puccinia triticina]